MSAATLTSKGQITIPAVVRAALSLDSGDRVEFVEIAPHQFAIIAANRPVTALKGLIRKPSQPVSIEAMNAAIARKGSMSQ